jgi:soluble lytic murein transglycosylase-like protein
MHTSIINPITPHLVFANQTLANAWLNNMSKRLKKWIPDEFLRRRLLIVIQYESKRAGLDTGLILSLITIESKFNKYAISNSGARGLMQVMPFWVEQIGTQQQDLFDVETNIRYGCTILRYYLIKEHGDMYRALAKYNGSLGRDTYPNLVYTAYNKYWQQ